MAHRALFARLWGRLVPRTDAVNAAGGAAYALGPREALARYAATGCISDTYYVKAEEHLDTAKKPRIRFVPSKVMIGTNLGRSLSSSLEDMGRKVLPGIGQRVVVAEAVLAGLTVREYAPTSTAGEEFARLAKAVDKILRR